MDLLNTVTPTSGLKVESSFSAAASSTILCIDIHPVEYLCKSFTMQCWYSLRVLITLAASATWYLVQGEFCSDNMHHLSTSYNSGVLLKLLSISFQRYVLCHGLIVQDISGEESLLYSVHNFSTNGYTHFCYSGYMLIRSTISLWRLPCHCFTCTLMGEVQDCDLIHRGWYSNNVEVTVSDIINVSSANKLCRMLFPYWLHFEADHQPLQGCITTS
jgi:hypothetical protein